MTQYRRHLTDRAWFWIAFLVVLSDLWIAIAAVHAHDYERLVFCAPFGFIAAWACIQLHAPLEFSRDRLTR